ncbi:hypothetical protein ACJMK2_027116 [Sinanodonta woodiana]|uniref:Uncharacterized protein n=1 Tax=Sinanodonta woodiana TaxID=1069815 RepID=A0ABD3XLU1_SINWO
MKQALIFYLDIALADKENKEQFNDFLYSIGEVCRDINNHLHLRKIKAENIDPLIKKFENCCNLKQKHMLQRQRGNAGIKQVNDAIDKYVTELRLVAKKWEF